LGPLSVCSSGETYSDADIEWLLDSAGAYIVAGVEQDAPCTVIPSSLIDHLRSKGQQREIQRKFTKVLIDTRLNSYPAHVGTGLGHTPISAGTLPNTLARPLFSLSWSMIRFIS